MLIITMGLSGSGKTTHSGALASIIGAVSVRSDIERKRLSGLGPLERSNSQKERSRIRKEHSIYTEAKSRETYNALLAIAGTAMGAGISMIVDAAFLRLNDRKQFMELADQAGCRFMILGFHAPLEVLKERVEKRRKMGEDASEAGWSVLEAQSHSQEPLTPSEERVSISINTSEPVDYKVLAERLKPQYQKAILMT